MKSEADKLSQPLIKEQAKYIKQNKGWSTKCSTRNFLFATIVVLVGSFMILFAALWRKGVMHK